jgi:predicted MFS family arabinose efflux permease
VLIGLLSAGNFVIGMGAFVVIGMLSPMAASFGMTSGGAGLVLTTYALAYAVGSPLAVAATGAWPRRRVLLIGMGLFGLGALLSALAPTPVALYATRVLAAVGAGLYTPVAAGVAAVASPPEERGRALARVFFGLTLAQVLGVPAGSFLAYSLGWPATFLVVAALAFACLAGVRRLVPGDLPFQATRLASLAEALADWRSLASVLFTTTFLGSLYVVYTYFTPLLEETMGFGRNQIALTLLVYGVGAVLGNLLGGRLTDAIGGRRTLFLLAGAQIVLTPLFSLLPIALPLLFGLAFVWPVFGWSFIAPQQSVLIELVPERANVMLALNAAAIYVGAAVGSAIGGGVIDRFGLGAVGLAGGLCCLVAMANLVLATRLARPVLPIDNPPSRV